MQALRQAEKPPVNEYKAEDYSRFSLQPRISFIIPSFNQAAYLGKCIDSILSQHYPHAELLVSDGGSTDGSKGIIDTYKDRLTYSRSSPDKGTWHANNLALEHATGEYIWVVNSDDGLVDGAIHAFLQALNQHPQAKWFTGKVLAVDGGGNQRAVFSPQRQPKTAGNSFLTECWIYHPATILHRDLAMPYAETDLLDWDLWIRLEKAGYKPTILDIPLAFLRFHEECKSFDSLGILQKQAALLASRKHDFVKVTNPKELAEYDQLLALKKLQIEQAAIKTSAYEGRKVDAVKLSIHMLFTRPQVASTRWYWGLVRRIFTGFTLSEVSPLAFLTERPE